MDHDQRAALARHGYDPDLRPRGVAGGPERIETGYPGQVYRWEGWPYLRNHVCELDGVEVDGHEFTDLEPVDIDSACLFCGRKWGEIEISSAPRR